MKRLDQGIIGALALLFTVLLIGGFSPTKAASDEPEYVGEAKCKACHRKIHETWMKDKHARAMDSLSAEEKKNPDCLICHTTGYGRPAMSTAKLENVQCEACHGPGSLYKSAKIMNKKKFQDDPEGQLEKAMAAGLVLPDEKVCIECHNKKSPTFKGFDFKEAVKEVDHH